MAACRPLVVALTVIALGVACHGETYDIIEPHKLPPVECPKGCALWTNLAGDGNDVNQSAVDALWRSKKTQQEAGSSCAQPGLSPFSDSSATGGYAGAYCYCKITGVADPRIGYCVSAPDTPEQINLQASPQSNMLVASFVTFGDLPSDSVPVAQLSTSLDMKDATNFTGVTHQYYSPRSDRGAQPVRKYNLHFVPLSGLLEGTNYFYRVAAQDPVAPPPRVPNATVCHGWTCTVQGQFCPPGTPGATPPGGDICCSGKWIPVTSGNPLSCGAHDTRWSDVISFKSLISRGPTKIAIFGDMGMMSDGNSMHGNILRDAQDDLVSAFVHMGDHAYQMSSADDHRGDGYMNAYQPLASTVPWIPVIGNHEYYDNAFFHRYLNQTYGVQLRTGPVEAGFCGHDLGICASEKELSERHPTLLHGEKITADSALGTFIARGRIVGHQAAKKSLKSTLPSNTSRWYSVDIGLIHMVALDMMVYPGGTPDYGPGDTYAAAQKDWLRLDLASVDRSKTPWVLAFAHHPMYCSSTTMGLGTSEYDEGIDNVGAEPGNLTEFQRSRIPKDKGYRGCLGTGMVGVNARADLEPLFLQYGVDMFLAGHEHDYESIFPVKNCPIGSPNCYIGDDFNKPKAPVHVVCGEGGTNGGDHFGDNIGPWTRKQLGQDTPGECTTLSSGGPTQGGCSAGYGRVTAHNASHLTYEYVLNVNGTVWDNFTIYQPNHGSFS